MVEVVLRGVRFHAVTMREALDVTAQATACGRSRRLTGYLPASNFLALPIALILIVAP